jgi:hypothetical protein
MSPATNEMKPQPFHEWLFIIAHSGPSPLLVRMHPDVGRRGFGSVISFTRAGRELG